MMLKRPECSPRVALLGMLLPPAAGQCCIFIACCQRSIQRSRLTLYLCRMGAIAATSLHPPLAAAGLGRQPSGQRYFAAAASSSRRSHCRLVPRCQQGHVDRAVGEAPSASGRRQLLQAATLLGLSPALGLALPAAAEEALPGVDSSRQAFFDITVDRKPLGRIVIEVPASAPATGGQRFLDLAKASPLCCCSTCAVWI